MAHSALYVRLMNSKEWRQLRAEVLTDEPLCRRCKQNHLVVPARCVHHIVEIDSCRTEQEAIDTCFRRSNLMPLCYDCHAAIHKERRSHSREAHQQRQQEALNRWIFKHTKHN